MAQYSMFFTTNGIGDGVAYTDTQHFAWLQSTFGDGICTGRANELDTEVSSGNILVKTGAAYVGGAFYESNTTVTVTIPTPSIGTTGYRIVVRKDMTTQTTRLTLLSSSDGVSAIPAVTQTSSIWDFSICTLTKTTGGVVTLTDTRRYIRAYYTRRVGGDETNWTVPGTDQYILGNLRIQAGVVEIELTGATQYATGSSSFPVMFSGKPLVIANVTERDVPVSNETTMAFVNADVTTSAVTLHLRDFATTGTRTYRVAWYAFGPV
jgi:hypothetical protein